MSQPKTAVPELDVRDDTEEKREREQSQSRNATPEAVPPPAATLETAKEDKSADSDIEMDDAEAEVEGVADNPAGSAKPDPAAPPPPALAPSPSPASPLPTPVPVPDIPEEWINLTFKWSGKTYDLRLSTSDLVYDLRANIETLTAVPPAAQKILGLGRTQLRGDVDGQRIATLNLKDGAKFTLVGTPEHLRFKEPELPPAAEWDLSYSSRDAYGNVLPPHRDPRNLRRVEQIIKKYPITVMNEPRPGKGLLVLDLDYTIADTRPLLDGALPPLECARPGLHQFLELVYQHYDIVVWSQTRWVWLESKLVELGVLGGDTPYKISFVVDRSTMFPIFSMRGGQMVKHEVKPLAYCWARFPHWSAKNIRAFKGAGTADGLRDRELDRLGQYLIDIATTTDDFTKIDHSQWKKRVKTLQAAQQATRAAAAQPDATGSNPPPPPPEGAGPGAGPSASEHGEGGEDGAGDGDKGTGDNGGAAP